MAVDDIPTISDEQWDAKFRKYAAAGCSLKEIAKSCGFADEGDGWQRFLCACHQRVSDPEYVRRSIRAVALCELRNAIWVSALRNPLEGVALTILFQETGTNYLTTNTTDDASKSQSVKALLKALQHGKD